MPTLNKEQAMSINKLIVELADQFDVGVEDVDFTDYGRDISTDTRLLRTKWPIDGDREMHCAVRYEVLDGLVYVIEVLQSVTQRGWRPQF